MFADDNLLPKAMLKDLDNNKIDVYDFLQDGPLIINFWFLACEPCKKEMIYLDRYNQKYSKYGFKILSVNTDNSRTFSRVKPFVNSKKYSFTVLSDPKSLFFRNLHPPRVAFLKLCFSRALIKNVTFLDRGL